MLLSEWRSHPWATSSPLDCLRAIGRGQARYLRISQAACEPTTWFSFSMLIAPCALAVLGPRSGHSRLTAKLECIVRRQLLGSGLRGLAFGFALLIRFSF